MFNVSTHYRAFKSFQEKQKEETQQLTISVILVNSTFISLDPILYINKWYFSYTYFALHYQPNGKSDIWATFWWWHRLNWSHCCLFVYYKEMEGDWLVGQEMWGGGHVIRGGQVRSTGQRLEGKVTLWVSTSLKYKFIIIMQLSFHVS